MVLFIFDFVCSGFIEEFGVVLRNLRLDEGDLVFGQPVSLVELGVCPYLGQGKVRDKAVDVPWCVLGGLAEGNRPELVFTLTRFAFRDKSVMLLTQGLGAQPFHKRIVVLVNEWTNSAAEMVANFAAENQLATIVGQKTRGNVLGAANFKVGGGYWLRLPVFGWFTSKGRSLEGNGVDPDTLVEVSPDALAAGKDNQMTSAIEIVNGLQ